LGEGFLKYIGPSDSFGDSLGNSLGNSFGNSLLQCLKSIHSEIVHYMNEAE